MAKTHDGAPFSVLMAGSAQRVVIALVLVGALWAAVAWALSGNAA